MGCEEMFVLFNCFCSKTIPKISQGRAFGFMLIRGLGGAIAPLAPGNQGQVLLKSLLFNPSRVAPGNRGQHPASTREVMFM